jgi:hypothetical protein
VNGLLAYAFWHQPADPQDLTYPGALHEFHAALAAHPPGGLVSSWTWVLDAPPWVPFDRQGTAYLDWYVVDGLAALSALAEAAVSGVRAAPHDAAAARSGTGAGALYRLVGGPATAGAGEVTLAWVDKPRGAARDAFTRRLQTTGGGVWRRQLVLGPGPEPVVVIDTPGGGTAGVAGAGWSASGRRVAGGQ